MKINSVTDLSSDYDAARRIAYTLAKVADRFGLPLHPYSPESLLQSAREQPETITPQEYVDLCDAIDGGAAVMARFPGEQSSWLSPPAPPPDPDWEARVQEARRRALQDILKPVTPDAGPGQ